jgi:hypothetical protein
VTPGDRFLLSPCLLTVHGHFLISVDATKTLKLKQCRYIFQHSMITAKCHGLLRCQTYVDFIIGEAETWGSTRSISLKLNESRCGFAPGRNESRTRTRRALTLGLPPTSALSRALHESCTFSGPFRHSLFFLFLHIPIFTHFYFEDGGDRFLRNVCKHLQDNSVTAQKATILIQLPSILTSLSGTQNIQRRVIG